MNVRRRRFILDVTVGYVIFATVWIFFSDRLLTVFTDIETISRLSMFKGLAFVVVTATMLWLVLHNVPEERSMLVLEDLQPPFRPTRFLLAIGVPVVTALMQWEFWEEIQPFAWLLFFPAVFISSRIGRLAGGVAATALSTLIVWYVFIPPNFSFAVARPFAVVAICVFFGTGIVISLLQEQFRVSERRAAEAIFRPLVEQSLAGIYIIQDGVFRYVNPQFAEMHGFADASEMIGLEVGAMVAPEDRDRVLALVQQRLNHEIEEVRYEFTGLLRNGVRVNFEVHGRAFKFRGRSAVIGLLLDVTERKRVEAAMASQKALLDRMSRVAKVGGWNFDAETKHGTWTEEVARIHDLDPADPTSVERGLQFYHGESRRQIEVAIQALVTQGAPFDVELELVSAKGIHKWVRSQGEPVYFDGKLVRAEGAFQDITDRKLAEQEILRLNADLEQRVELRTAELASANHELDAFAYAVSHDLRAPLRAMSGFSFALVEDHGAELSEGAKDYIDEIVRATRKMGELIEGLLQLSRSVRGELKRNDVDLSCLAQMIVTELAAQEPERSVDVRIQTGIQVQGDERTLEIAMRNLLGNAWKYTGRKDMASISVSETDYPEGWQGSGQGERWISVADNGAGFDEAYAKRLFQPFQRLHRQDEFPGLGIGLATVSRIIHRHGGEICAHSRPGEGARFSFYIPS